MKNILATLLLALPAYGADTTLYISGTIVFNNLKVSLAPNASTNIVAASCSRDDVAAAIALASNGDTVEIPSGTCEWSSGLTISKAIILAGLGTVTKDVNNRAIACGTKIQCSVSAPVITWNLVANQNSRMTGIEFVKGSAYGVPAAISVYGLNTDSRRMRIDNCTFTQLNAWCLFLDTVLGVVDHCTFAAKNAGLCIIDAASWDGTQGVDSYGNGSWAEGDNYGTDQFTFLEDNTFVGEFCRSSSTVTITASGNVTFTVPAGLESSIGVTLIAGYPITAMFWNAATGEPDHTFSMIGTVNSYSGTTLVMASTSANGAGSSKNNWTLAYSNTGFDGQRGTRAVIRNNLFANASWQNHGLEASHTRGGRVLEFYNNEMVGNTTGNSPLFFRSGTGLIHDNTITNFQTGVPSFNLMNFSSRQYEASPWGGPDGRNPWHDNTAAAIVTGTVTSTNTYTMRDNTKTWTLNQYQNYTIRATSGVSVSSVTRSGSTVTVNTAAAHGLTTGDEVSIMGADQRWYNKLHSNCTVVDGDTFTVILDVAPASPATGTIVMRKHGFYGLIKSSATDGTLVWSEGVNGADYTLQLEVGDTYEINQVDTVMDQCGMGAGSLLVIPLVENPPVGWPDQVVSTIYQWNNGSALFDNRIDFSGATYATIVNGRNYTNNVSKPGYIPYTYPHPLIP